MTRVLDVWKVSRERIILKMIVVHFRGVNIALLIFSFYFSLSITEGQEGLFVIHRVFEILTEKIKSGKVTYHFIERGLFFAMLFQEIQYENCVPGRETTVSDVCLCVCSHLRIAIKMLSMILVWFFQSLFFCGPESCKTESSSFLTGLSITQISVTCKLTLTWTIAMLHFYAKRPTDMRPSEQYVSVWWSPASSFLLHLLLRLEGEQTYCMHSYNHEHPWT